MKNLFAKSLLLFFLTIGIWTGYHHEILAQDTDAQLYHFDGVQLINTNIVTQESELVAHSAPEFSQIFNIADEDSFIIHQLYTPRKLLKTNSDFSEYREYSEQIRDIGSNDKVFINSEYTKLIFEEFDGIKVYDIAADEKDLLFEPETYKPDEFAYHNGDVFYIQRRVETGSMIYALHRSDMDGNTEHITDLDFARDLYIGDNGKAYIMGSGFNSNSIIRVNLDGSNMETIVHDLDLRWIDHFSPATSHMFYRNGSTVVKIDLTADEIEETELFDTGAYSPNQTIFNPETNSIIYHVGIGVVFEYNMDTEVLSPVTNRLPDQKFTIDAENERIYFTHGGAVIQTDLNYDNWTEQYRISDGSGPRRSYFELETQNFYYLDRGDIFYFNVHDEDPEPAVLAETDGNTAHDFVVDYNTGVAFIYSDGNGIFRIDLGSGDMTSLEGFPRHLRTLAYNRERDEVVFGSNQWIYSVPATGDDSPSILQLLDGSINTIQYLPQMDGYVYNERGEDDYTLYFKSADGGEREALFTTDQISQFYLVADGNLITSDDYEPAMVSQISLNQNYPNPFNPTTKISYELPETSEVKLEVFNVTGQRVAVLEDGLVNAGNHTINFDASRLASGLYLYQLRTSSAVITKKMMLIK